MQTLSQTRRTHLAAAQEKLKKVMSDLSELKAERKSVHWSLAISQLTNEMSESLNILEEKLPKMEEGLAYRVSGEGRNDPMKKREIYYHYRNITDLVTKSKVAFFSAKDDLEKIAKKDEDVVYKLAMKNIAAQIEGIKTELDTLYSYICHTENQLEKEA